MMSFVKFTIFVLLIILSSCAKQKTKPIELEHTPDNIELFGKGFISTALYERDIAISADGNEIIYTLGNFKQTRRSLVSITKKDGKWGEKQVLGFSGKYNDIEPFFSVDGNQLFFASNRPMEGDTTRTDYNIWVTQRNSTGWDEPSPLDTLINTEKDEFFPAVSKNGNLYFTATREDGIGREDIFLSTFTNGKYQSPSVLDSTVNTTVFEFNAYISPDENLLVFSSFGRKDGLGGGDLYFSKKDSEGNWQEAKNMGATVNSEKLDYCPFIDTQRGNFYFTSDRENNTDTLLKTTTEIEKEAYQVLNGMGNIYRINVDRLNLKK